MKALTFIDCHEQALLLEYFYYAIATHERSSGDQKELYKILRCNKFFWYTGVNDFVGHLWKRWQVYNSVVVEYALLFTTYPILVYIVIEWIHVWRVSLSTDQRHVLQSITYRFPTNSWIHMISKNQTNVICTNNYGCRRFHHVPRHMKPSPFKTLSIIIKRTDLDHVQHILSYYYDVNHSPPYKRRFTTDTGDSFTRNY